MLLEQPIQLGHLAAAGPAPGRPDVHQHDLACVIGKPVYVAVEITRLHGRRRLTGDRQVLHLLGPPRVTGDRRVEQAQRERGDDKSHARAPAATASAPLPDEGREGQEKRRRHGDASHDEAKGEIGVRVLGRAPKNAPHPGPEDVGEEGAQHAQPQSQIGNP